MLPNLTAEGRRGLERRTAADFPIGSRWRNGGGGECLVIARPVGLDSWNVPATSVVVIRMVTDPSNSWGVGTVWGLDACGLWGRAHGDRIGLVQRLDRPATRPERPLVGSIWRRANGTACMVYAAGPAEFQHSRGPAPLGGRQQDGQARAYDLDGVHWFGNHDFDLVQWISGPRELPRAAPDGLAPERRTRRLLTPIRAGCCALRAAPWGHRQVQARWSWWLADEDGFLASLVAELAALPPGTRVKLRTPDLPQDLVAHHGQEFATPAQAFPHLLFDWQRVPLTEPTRLEAAA